MNSNWSEQLEVKTEAKERNKVRKEKLTGYFFDLSKLTFAAIVLGGISPLFSENVQSISWVSVVVGCYATYIFALFANKILKN